MREPANSAEQQGMLADTAFTGQLTRGLPQLGSACQRLYRSLYEQTHLPPEVLELCRLRLAQLHRSEADWQLEEAALPSAQREQLSRWASSDDFDAATRACLAFAEVYAMDASAISDAQAAAVQAHFGDAGLVLLIEALGVFDGLIRLNLLWRAPPRAGTGEGSGPCAEGQVSER